MTQVFEDLLRAAERFFRIDHPVVRQQLMNRPVRTRMPGGVGRAG